jgi:hypothetical protein
VLNPDQRAELYDQLDGRAAWFYEATTTPGVGRIKAVPTEEQIAGTAYSIHLSLEKGPSSIPEKELNALPPSRWSCWEDRSS